VTVVIWKDICDKLTEKGLKVYSPGTKVSDVVEPFITVRYAGGSQESNFTSWIDTYELIIYVPRDRYSLLEGAIDDVRTAMLELEPKLMPTQYNSISTTMFDTNISAHYVIALYRNYKRFKSNLYERS